MNDSLVPITHTVPIPMSELRFKFARSSGPGGQQANRSATQVELLFDVASSPSLSETQRRRVPGP
jgi:ribosome-associated protein